MNGRLIAGAVTVAAFAAVVAPRDARNAVSDWAKDPWGYDTEKCEEWQVDPPASYSERDIDEYKRKCPGLGFPRYGKLVRTADKAEKDAEQAKLDALAIPDKPFTVIRYTSGTTARDYRQENDLPHDFTIQDMTAGTVATVERWIDGDTVHTSAGRIRLIGIDTPELDSCIGEDAKRHAESQAPVGSTVVLLNPPGVDNRDRYDRLLRYVITTRGSDSDVGYSLIDYDLADARYDSQDGYDYHPWEEEYRAIDRPNEGRSACAHERVAESLENDNNDWFTPDHMPGNASSLSSPSSGYTGPRCYSPGGETWLPC